MFSNNGIIAEIFSTCQEMGDSKAFVDGDSGFVLTFKSFLERSMKLSDSLPVKEDEIVAILIENNVNYFVIVLACFLKGAIVHLVDPKSSISELRHSLSITKPKTVFTSNFSLGKAMQLKLEFSFIECCININKTDLFNVMYMDELLQKSEVNINGYKIPVFARSKVALIVNSSGTTGPSKCVMLNYGNINYLFSYIRNPEYFDITAKDCTISVCPFFHLYGTLISMYTLVTGMTSVVMEKFSITRYLELIEQYEATILFLVPPIATLLAKHSTVANCKLTSLRDILSAAAPLGIEVQQILKDRLNITVRQMYGMSEISFCTVIPLNAIPGKRGSVGTPLPGCVIEIRHLETDEVLPSGQLGQLCVKGDLTTKGYWNNVAATEDAFDTNGFIFTGDIGYCDPDGYIYVVDRLKEIIKYKGHQVSPSEIEDFITSHPQVKEAAVIGKLDEYAGEVPIAFVVRLSEGLEEEDVIKFVARHFGCEKHLHGGVRFVEEIPKTASGKILRRKLREMLNNNI